MPGPQEPSKKEQPSTYFVQDRENKEELLRLIGQDQMVTALMGGVLPEQADPSIFHRVLDVACGVGRWAIEAAQRYPTMSVCGVDISASMVDHARAQAEDAGVADRVEFHVMDALLYMDFPPGNFDLVNLRLGNSFLRTWEWIEVLIKMQRVCRRGGVIRITECENGVRSSSSALVQIFEMSACAMFQTGRLFEQAPNGLTAHLEEMLTRAGLRQVQKKAYTFEYRAETPEGQAFQEDMQHLFRIGRPFLKKAGCLTENFDELCRIALDEMRQPNFWATWNFLTLWGINPSSPKYPRRD